MSEHPQHAAGMTAQPPLDEPAGSGWSETRDPRAESAAAGAPSDDRLRQALLDVRAEVAKSVVGQDGTVTGLLIALLSHGHVLLEGVPGVAKTLIGRAFAASLSLQFGRVQFTPDLMPGDVIGTSVFNSRENSFEFKRGPIFSNIVLIDEINRAPAKTQAALFEVMEERQVTVDGHTYQMAPPFLVVATQNPVEQEGTYPLPEAQLDRFMFNIKLTYPAFKDEVEVVKTTTSDESKKVSTVLSGSEISYFQHLILN